MVWTKNLVILVKNEQISTYRSNSRSSYMVCKFTIRVLVMLEGNKIVGRLKVGLVNKEKFDCMRRLNKRWLNR
jgi:hypothetical protein